MDTLDDLVLDQLTARVFQPERLAELLKELLDRTESGQQKLRSELKDLRKALRETDTRLSRLYEAIETEALALDDTLRRRIATLQQEREERIRLISMAERRLDAPRAALTPERVEVFARVLRQKLRDGDIAFRTAYLRLFVERVDVDDAEIRISGPKAEIGSASCRERVCMYG